MEENQLPPARKSVSLSSMMYFGDSFAALGRFKSMSAGNLTLSQGNKEAEDSLFELVKFSSSWEQNVVNRKLSRSLNSLTINNFTELPHFLGRIDVRKLFLKRKTPSIQQPFEIATDVAEVDEFNLLASVAESLADSEKVRLCLSPYLSLFTFCCNFFILFSLLFWRSF